MSNNIAKIGKIRSLAYTTATSLHNSIIEFEARKEALASLLGITTMELGSLIIGLSEGLEVDSKKN